MMKNDITPNNETTVTPKNNKKNINATSNK